MKSNIVPMGRPAVPVGIVLALAVSMWAINAAALTVIVPDNYPTIQQAINAVGSCDTVFVRGGIYYEHITINRCLRLVGENRNTTIIDGSGSGTVITLPGVSSVEISGLTVCNGTWGIDLDGSSNNRIRDCVVRSSHKRGLFIHRRSSWNTIEDCDVTDNGISGGGEDAGIDLNDWLGQGPPGQIHNTITNCNVYGNHHDGMVGYVGTDYTLVTDCDVYSNEHNGIVVGWSRWRVHHCRVHSNGDVGIFLDTAANTIVDSCTIWSNRMWGIDLWYYAHNNYLTNNEIYSNVAGVHLAGPAVTANTVCGNWIHGNVYGVLADSGYVTADNKFYHNWFDGNGTSARLEDGPNIWDNGYPDGGNRWSDYAGEDMFSGPGQNLPGPDGIGDVPYVIDAYNRDNYPMLEVPGPSSVKPTTWGAIKAMYK